MKNWFKQTLVRDIQVFIGFANFYQHFIQGFSRIATPLTSLLKRIKLSKLATKMFRADDNNIVDDNGSRANRTVMNLSKNKKSRKLTYIPNIRITKESNFLTPNAKKIFNHLQLAFIKALIF